MFSNLVEVGAAFAGNRRWNTSTCQRLKIYLFDKIWIFDFLDFFRKQSPENRQNRVFLDSRNQHQILNLFRFLYMTSISYINHHFRAPSPLKPLKSIPRYQNLPGESLMAHSDHWGTLSDPMYLQKLCFFCLCWPFLFFKTFFAFFLTLFDLILSELKWC